jgi:hypothetical protein
LFIGGKVGVVVSISSGRNWKGTSEGNEAANINTAGSPNKVIVMPANKMLRKGSLPAFIDIEYNSVYFKAMDMYAIGFKDKESPITRGRVMRLVETCKRHDCIPSFIGCKLDKLDLSGINFGQSIFRYAALDGTVFDKAGTSEADFIMSNSEKAVFLEGKQENGRHGIIGRVLRVLHR